MIDWNDKLVHLAEELLKTAQRQKANTDIYMAGTIESQTLGAVADILNYYRSMYHGDDEYVLRMLLDMADRQRNQRTVAEVMEYAKRS